jgi:acyl-CoA reductase-like NAD-dependent aldehyde dehydrogenase
VSNLSYSSATSLIPPSLTVSKGAKALIPESHFVEAKEGTTYVAPQVLIDVDHSMKVMSEETFGPVFGIMKVSRRFRSFASARRGGS